MCPVLWAWSPCRPQHELEEWITQHLLLGFNVDEQVLYWMLVDIWGHVASCSAETHCFSVAVSRSLLAETNRRTPHNLVDLSPIQRLQGVPVRTCVYTGAHVSYLNGNIHSSHNNDNSNNDDWYDANTSVEFWSCNAVWGLIGYLYDVFVAFFSPSIKPLTHPTCICCFDLTLSLIHYYLQC